MSRLLWLAPASVFTLACGESEPRPPRAKSAASAPSPAVPVAPGLRADSLTEQPFPPLGLALADSLGNWCAAFEVDSLVPGTQVTLIFMDPESDINASAQVVRHRDEPCSAAVPQFSLEQLAAYDLDLGQGTFAGDRRPAVLLAVAAAATWRRGSDGIMRADLNGDGSAEEARMCRADEGQHFTVWSSEGGAKRLRWHGYFDWGALVDETCQPGEERGQPAPTGGT
jgi:hypothetical protein